jgi:hypothetical protein
MRIREGIVDRGLVAEANLAMQIAAENVTRFHLEEIERNRFAFRFRDGLHRRLARPANAEGSQEQKAGEELKAP